MCSQLVDSALLAFWILVRMVTAAAGYFISWFFQLVLLTTIFHIQCKLVDHLLRSISGTVSRTPDGSSSILVFQLSRSFINKQRGAVFRYRFSPFSFFGGMMLVFDRVPPVPTDQ